MTTSTNRQAKRQRCKAARRARLQVRPAWSRSRLLLALALHGIDGRELAAELLPYQQRFSSELPR